MVDRDCFVPPPDVHPRSDAKRSQSDRSDGEPHYVSAVRAYLNEHPAVAGEIVVLNSERIAVGFTQDGCLHRREIASRAGVAESHIDVFRALYPHSRVKAVHAWLTKALRSGRPAELKSFNIVEWGPGVKGTEDVTVLRPAHVDQIRIRLSQLADCDAGLFSVDSIAADDLPSEN